ncbi:hypothetical protein TNCV_4822691 [Trichonephila clavipes]|nr:hypothetical protein TNCV_4822691 [Trichonephila clavipes]
MVILDAEFRNARCLTITEKLALMADNGQSGNCRLLRNCYTARTLKRIGRKQTKTEQGLTKSRQNDNAWDKAEKIKLFSRVDSATSVSEWSGFRTRGRHCWVMSSSPSEPPE